MTDSLQTEHATNLHIVRMIKSSRFALYRLKLLPKHKNGLVGLSCKCRGSVAGTVDVEHGSATHDDIHARDLKIGQWLLRRFQWAIPRAQNKSSIGPWREGNDDIRRVDIASKTC